MKVVSPVLSVVLALIVISHPTAAGGSDLLPTLAAAAVESVRINLNPWGPHLGFEVEVDGRDPRVAPLLRVISGAQPSKGHKCANRGAIRFRIAGGAMVAVGLLPSHSTGFYQLRLYDGDRLEGVYKVSREELLDALEALGVPPDDPAFAG